MDRAVLKRTGEVVSADEVKERFGGRPPAAERFVCPLCGQKVSLFAAGGAAKRSAHFRHERNNPQARDCELFVSAYGFPSAYRRLPVALTVRKARSKEPGFTVEALLVKPDAKVLEKAARDGAVLLAAGSRYRVSASLFARGPLRVRLDRVCLSWSSLLRLEGGHLDMRMLWGGVEDDTGPAAVFSRDPCSGSGRRYRRGEAVPAGSDVYLLVPPDGAEEAASAFVGVREAGKAGGPRRSQTLVALEATLPPGGAELERARAFLARCALTVGAPGVTPELLWPPSVVESGAAVSVFARSQTAVAVPDRVSSAGGLKVLGELPDGDEALLALERLGGTSATGVFDAPDGLSYAALSAGGPSCTAFLREPRACPHPPAAKRLPHLVEGPDGSAVVFPSKGRLTQFGPGPRREVSSARGGDAIGLKQGWAYLAEVDLKGLSGSFAALWGGFDGRDAGEQSTCVGRRVEDAVPPGVPRDVRRAQLRSAGLVRREGVGADREKASGREGGGR